MASANEMNLHISTNERAKWNNTFDMLDTHIGSSGTDNHAMANGTVPGFSTCDFSNEYKAKLDGIEDGALNNPLPEYWPANKVTGLNKIATSGNWADLSNKPAQIDQVVNGTYNAATVGGIRFTVGTSAPTAPADNKDVWFDTNDMIVKVRKGGQWQTLGAAYR
ncbi:MAG: hypothetical protein HDQ88_06860 [Clostridia bacterium]|nr:hypothetical protein [Clostridia bacterium]